MLFGVYFTPKPQKKRQMNQANLVEFKVLKLEDFPKFGSEVFVGAYLKGLLDKDKIYYTDCRNTDWIFYVNDTCQLIQK